MRFQRLHIPAFGPFTNLEISLPSAKIDLHVVYGANEAGKSCLLRAIRDLLFGIHSQSTDNFLHEYKNLLLKGEIENRAGDRLVFQRRKGNKNTLLGEDGKPLQEGALRPFLGSVDQAYFSAMFGLGGSELRDGATQLLKGEGEIGKALFSASLGGTPIQQVLEAMVTESETLFKGRVTTNVSIRPAVNRHKELLKQSREAVVATDTWEQLEKELANEEAAKAKLESEDEQIARELAWVERCLDALPSVGRWNEETRLLSELPALPDVASDFVERARTARADVRTATDRVVTLTERITQLDGQLAGCATSPRILAIADDLDVLHQDVGAYREQKRTLVKLQQEQAGLEPVLQAAMKSLELQGDLSLLEGLRLSSAAQLSCEAAANALQAALKDQSEHGSKAAGLKADIESDETELALLPETDLTPLREALADAAEATEANKTLAVSQQSVDKLARAVATERALVPGLSGNLESIPQLAVPAPATIRKFRELFDGAKRDIDINNQLCLDEQDSINSLEDELRRLERRGELPSEDSLKQARQHRDHGWELVLADWKGAGAKEELDPALPLAEAFPLAITRADNIADQLRLDAEAVAQAEEKRLRIQSCRKKMADAQETLATLRSTAQEHQNSWESEWVPVGMAPRSPDEMEEWRENWVRLRETISKLREAEAELRSKNTKVQSARDSLAAVLMDSRDKPFTVLFEAARTRVQKGEEATGQRTAIEKRLEKLRKDLAALDRKSVGLRPAVEIAETNWKQRCRTLGLPEDTTPESGLKLLQERKELFAKFDSWSKLFREAEVTSGDIRRYEQSVGRYAVELGIEGDQTESQEAGLWKSLTQARKAQTEHDQLTSQFADANSDLANAKQMESQAKHELEELMRLSKLEASQDLEPLLANLERRTVIQDRISHLRETLGGLARGQGLNEFITRIQAEDADDLPRRKTLLETRREEKKAELQEVQAVLNGLNSRKKELEEAGDAAANYRQQAESTAAALKNDASRFIRLRLAAHFLQSQIERFREENQGPLLERSGQLFNQLTRGAFDGLTADFNDADIPVIVGRRASDVHVPVTGMSDGSRDQLYLALRLAAMERYLEEHEPMPLILDDLLITFDNERSKAFLQQLAQLSERTQVFLFTHHEHLIDLCHEVVGKDRFALHRLGINKQTV